MPANPLRTTAADRLSSPPRFPAASIIGYPRIGRDRELKKAEEAYWAGSIDQAALEDEARRVRAATRIRLAELGLDEPSARPDTFSFYDQVLDVAVTVGAISARFGNIAHPSHPIDLNDYFTLARGHATQVPLEMTKWFDSNYHYLVPEIGPSTALRLASRRLIDQVREAAADGDIVRPVLVGPVTFLLLAKPEPGAPAGFDPLDRLDDLVGVYAELLSELRAAGAQWVQLDEPGLVADQRIDSTQLADAIARAEGRLAALASRPALFVTTPYGDLGSLLPALLATGVEAVHLDLVRGALPSVKDLSGLGSTQLVAGVVDGHNVWRTDLGTAAAKLAALGELVTEVGGDASAVSVSTSTSLLHVPHDVTRETSLPDHLVRALAFADQKVQEVLALAQGHTHDGLAITVGRVDGPQSVARTGHGVSREDVRARVAALTDADRTRTAYADRAGVQRETHQLPLLPTTTIGSFPQTRDVRQARSGVRSGRITQDEYTRIMRDEIRRVIDVQESIGLDVLVHGEPERNDMVQYFAEHLDGFATTIHGWVQSYGSRCTRPSILWGDVTRPAPITVEWSAYAQSLSARPVKGMLTGPVTILAWSFVRDDQPLGETADQVALALRDEIADLETAGIGIIQVDEPALRELLPLRGADQGEYLRWSVGSFRLATAGAQDSTQIHTHLCYSEFGEVIDAIDALDADVTSIESARSKMEILSALDTCDFARGIGPGVWDIHSPRVPSAEEISDLLRSALRHVPADRLWVNPDCGLKTRGYLETEASLINLVSATRQVREHIVPGLVGVG
ncbi:5-methyltetrahydropteroyltriglutamate--homocysteine S-methyltransferase [Devriesea agamarum]|uniref:5-methyltetrahydropteroyltriglutamate-- homocysteine S-methyltransferase n=1 Tax=Devriesea agamarum TaxID=472569 RepID=UPI00071C34D7|nr:5-methyltetrahydropteroyltriglutamate--homocysteine S-methyltransferase [Devriesea agamarum]